MSTDYIVFIHGVNVRNEEAYSRQANEMFLNIKASINNPSRTVKPVILYWGNVGQSSTNNLLMELKASPQWKKFWFQDLRTTQFLPFVGDAALYLSRTVSKAIVEQLTEQALNQIGLSLEQLKEPPKGDRLHLVTHSWGTVVLFDILFSSRWEEDAVSPQIRQLIENMRRGFFGVGTDLEKEFGIPLASIHTMGSPIALFNLVNIQGGNSFNLTPKLKEFLEKLQVKLKKPLPWKNYAHPGDPIAYPLKGVIPLFLDLAEDQNIVSVEDVISPSSWIGRLFGRSILPVINGGKAHGSYWTERKVAKMIGKVIQSS
ncbi:MAG: hypothetical protein DCF20_15605 [Pseudanabaena sp.]|nr:MAG: hypothetical protein DCF20_15605 [Pseudanabaena sp.]